MKPYRPSIRRLQEDFARRLCHKRMLERARAGRTEIDTRRKDIDLDNSEPWLPDANCISDYIHIAKQVTASFEKWGPKPTDSSAR